MVEKAGGLVVAMSVQRFRCETQRQSKLERHGVNAALCRAMKQEVHAFNVNVDICIFVDETLLCLLIQRNDQLVIKETYLNGIWS